MNTFLSSMTTSDSVTANGAVTNSTSGSYVTDLFGAIGSSRYSPDSLLSLFIKAYSENSDLALRCLQFCRDPRDGMGERKLPLTWVKWLSDAHPDVALKILTKIPLVGRFKDLEAFMGTKLENEALQLWVHSIFKDANPLAAKWMPRKGDVFNKARRIINVTPKTLRKALVALTNVVESKMCAQDWDNINFAQVPSIAHKNYYKAFLRNCSKYQKYLESLEKGKTKINSSVLYPHNVLYSENKGIKQAQWDSLPNFISETASFLPVVDVSFSMECPSGDPSYSCMQIAIALGMYTAERNKSSFKNHFITFSETPELQYCPSSETLDSRLRTMKTAGWGYSTDMDAAFNLVLKTAVNRKLKQKDLPSHLIVFSDMEFNDSGNVPVSKATAFNFKKEGYNMPKLVFWNLNSREGNVPVRFDESGTMLCSGFSPSLMKSLLQQKITSPLDLVKEAVCVPKYDY